MLYLHITDLHKSFTDKPLLSAINFTILKGQKVALVAKNWAWKSTLIKILMGAIEPTQGTVDFHKSIKVWFLNQTFDAPWDMTVWDAIFLYKNHIWELIRKYEILLVDKDSDHEIIHQTLEEIESVHWWEYETKVKSIISQLQLNPFLDKKIETLSWWEAKRVALAKALLDEPDFLVLDEPTNHLDLDMIEWLEKYLKKTDMTLLMVTHDRYFLERVCTDIYELDRWVIHTYSWNYENFLMKKSEREEREQLSVHKLKQFYKQELAWIRKAPRARQSKSVDREKKFYNIESDFHTKKGSLDEQAVRLSFDVQERRLGWKILKIHKLSKAYGEKIILDKFTHNFKQGERVGIMWKNGVGKSTFMNILTGTENYDSWSMEFWPTVEIGYYQQKHAMVDSDKTVLEYVKDISNRIVIGKWTIITATKILERFLFSPKQQQTRVSSLSGWERRRLHLLRVLIKNPNFLILDEPTNDLDLMTLAVLEDFLLAYQGCLIVITHDRFFMDRIVDHLFIFEWNGKVQDFWWTYSEFKRESLSDNNEKNNNSKKNLIWPHNDIDVTDSLESPLEVQFTKTPKKLTYNEKFEFEQLSKDIHRLEERKHEISVLFQQEETDFSKIKDLGHELSKIISELEIKENRWLELAERS